MNPLERRYTRALVEVRASEDRRTIGGYAAKFNRYSQNLGGFVEQIDARFFNKSAGDGWPHVLARYNHDDNMLLGTTEGGTLRLGLDGEGLTYDVDVPLSRGDVFELVQRGDVAKSSFAFRVFEDDWHINDQDFLVRTLVSGQLVDVAPVNSPAYMDTSTGLRSLAERVEADVEDVQQAADNGELKRFFESPKTHIDVAPSAQSDPHALVAVRQRRADLLEKRRS